MKILVEVAPTVNKPPPGTWDALPPEVLSRLSAEGINSPKDWRALSRARRRNLFGIVPSVVATIDRAALP